MNFKPKPINKNDKIFVRYDSHSQKKHIISKQIWNLFLFLNLFFLPFSALQAQCNCMVKGGCFPNPDLVSECEGLNIILVLDESGSIFNAGVEQEVEQGVMDFVNALNGTPAELAIVDFSTTSAIVSDYSSVDQNYIDNFIFPYLTHDDTPVIGYTGETYNSIAINSTNWQAALQDVRSIGGADLVVFFTDGNPTAPNGGGNQQQNLNDACIPANDIKFSGTHIFMVGVGEIELDNLQSISGTDAYDGTNISTADYSLTSDFSQLGTLLEGIALGLCGNNGGGTPSLATEKLRSDCVNGQVTFRVNITNTGDGAATDVILSDKLENGYSFISASVNTGQSDEQNDVVTWNVGDLQPNMTAFIDIVVDVNSGGNYSNTAVISASNIEGMSFPTFEGGMPECCEFSATCDLDPTLQVLQGCDISVLPPPFTDPEDVFSQIGDNPCGELVLIVSDEVTGSLCPDGINVSRTYRLFDDLDEDGEFDVEVEDSEICVQFFSIRDTEPPTIENLPQYPDLACGESLPIPPLLTTDDNCDGAGVAQASIDPFFPDYCNGYTVTYRFTATDNCGNTTVETTSFFVNPAPLPVITCPAVEPIACTAALDYEPLPASYTNGLPAPCGISGFLDGEIIDVDYNNCGGTLTIRYTWENPCDIIIVGAGGGGEDFPPVIIDCVVEVLAAPEPVINCPTLESISCEDVENYVPPMAEFDNDIDGICNISGQVSGEVTTTNIEDGCIQSLIITYSGLDECEKEIEPITCIVEVFDDVPPVIVCPTNLVDLPCNAETPVADIMLVNVTDNCTNEMDIMISHIGDMDNASTGCPGSPFIVTRTYQAEDACGNIAPCTQTITFAEDENGPSWVNCIPETTITCEADLATSLSFPDLVDEPCRGFTTTETDIEVVGTPGCPGTQYFYTFMATDPCGRQAICTQVYIIAEQELTIECPEELTVECNDPNRETIIQDWFNAVGTDITTPCGDAITVTNNYSPDGFEGNCTNSLTGSQVITFSIMDNCGRNTSCDVELHIVDTEAPLIIRPPMDEMRPCGPGLETQFQVWLADVGTATAFDACGGVTWSTLPQNPVLDGLSPVEVTFVATDACGNSTTTTASFIPMDNEVPIITMPAQHITIECSDGDVDAIFQDWLDNHGFAQAFDLCGAITWSILGGTPEIDYRCDGSAMPTYVDFVATDEAGNQALTTGVFDVNDFTPPVFSFVPEDLTVSCDASELEGGDAFGMPEVTDNCSNITLSFEDETVGGDCGFHLIRTWTAKDDCGNEARASQTINVIDTQAPELFFNHPDLIGLEDGDEVTFNCDDNFVFVTSDVTAVDDCSAMVNISLFDFTLLQGNCGIDGFYRKMVCTWTGADGCGNVTDLSITMIITDDEAPVFTSVLEDMTLDCRDTPPVTPPTAMDNCSEDLIIEFSDLPFVEDCQNGFEITRIWTATDECGNIATMIQTFIMEASPGPVFNLFAASVNIVCGEIEDLQAPTCTTDCGDYELTHDDEMMSADCSENMTLIRTWTATDDCGMSSTATQTIIMEADTEAPALSTFPSEKFILCNETPDFNEVTATDNCSEVTLNFEDVISEDGCDDFYTRTWTASDACGNTVIKTQVIVRIPDSETPEFVNIPEDGLVLDCGENAHVLMPEVTDNCGVDRLTKEDEIIEGDCADTYTILRTWTAIDWCGNASSVQRSFVVEIDNTAPIFLEVPESYSIGCGEVPVFGTPRFVDYCSETELSTTDETIIGTCNGSAYSRTKTWTITDACGNSRTASQTIDVEEDIIAPVMTGLEDYEVDCDGLEASLSTPNVSDNCSEVTVAYEDIVGEENCLSGYEIERTWTATDACGNTTIHTQIVQVTGLIGTNGILDDTTEQGKTTSNNQRLNLQNTRKPVTSFKIYPNPVRQELFLQLKNNEMETGLVRIFTITGKLVREMEMMNLGNEQPINVQDLTNGLYILTISLDGTQYQAKFTKTR